MTCTPTVLRQIRIRGNKGLATIPIHLYGGTGVSPHWKLPGFTAGTPDSYRTYIRIMDGSQGGCKIEVSEHEKLEEAIQEEARIATSLVAWWTRTKDEIYDLTLGEAPA